MYYGVCDICVKEKWHPVQDDFFLKKGLKKFKVRVGFSYIDGCYDT